MKTLPDNPEAPPPSVAQEALTSFYYFRTGQPWSKIIAAFLAGVLAGLWLA